MMPAKVAVRVGAAIKHVGDVMEIGREICALADALKINLRRYNQNHPEEQRQKQAFGSFLDINLAIAETEGKTRSGPGDEK